MLQAVARAAAAAHVALGGGGEADATAAPAAWAECATALGAAGAAAADVGLALPEGATPEAPFEPAWLQDVSTLLLKSGRWVSCATLRRRPTPSNAQRPPMPFARLTPAPCPAACLAPSAATAQTVVALESVAVLIPHKGKKAKAPGVPEAAAAVGACARQLQGLFVGVRAGIDAVAESAWVPCDAEGDAARDQTLALWFDAAQCAAPLVAEAGATRAAVLKKLRDSQLHSAKRLRDALDAEILRVDKMAR